MTNPSPTEAPRCDAAEIQQVFARARALIILYGILSAAALGAVALAAATGHVTTPFEWIRSSVVLVSTALVYWLTAAATRGSRSAYGRIRAIAVIVPVTIIAVDLIPGVAPLWFTLAQTPCALALAAAALVLNGARLRTAFNARG